MKAVKLTLLVPFATARTARLYAKQHGTSISALVTSLFASLSKTPGKTRRVLSPLTASSVGLIKLSKRNKADLIYDALKVKYRLE